MTYYSLRLAKVRMTGENKTGNIGRIFNIHTCSTSDNYDIAVSDKAVKGTCMVANVLCFT